MHHRHHRLLGSIASFPLTTHYLSLKTRTTRRDGRFGGRFESGLSDLRLSLAFHRGVQHQFVHHFDLHRIVETWKPSWRTCWRWRRARRRDPCA